MKIALLLLAGLGLASNAAAKDTITFMTESYPPFSYEEPGGNYRGVSIDQVQIIMKDSDLPFTLEMVPWARAISSAETQSMHCVFSAARTPERETRFKWIEPLFIDRNILVRHTGSRVSATTLDDTKKYTVGTHRADYTESLLRSMGFPNIDLSSDVDTTLRKLLQGRIDMMPMSESVYNKLKVSGAEIERVLVFTEQHLGIACNRDVADDLIARMQSNLDRLIRDGVQGAIFERYGVAQPR